MVADAADVAVGVALSGCGVAVLVTVAEGAGVRVFVAVEAPGWCIRCRGRRKWSQGVCCRSRRCWGMGIGRCCRWEGCCCVRCRRGGVVVGVLVAVAGGQCCGRIGGRSLRTELWAYWWPYLRQSCGRIGGCGLRHRGMGMGSGWIPPPFVITTEPLATLSPSLIHQSHCHYRPNPKGMCACTQP